MRYITDVAFADYPTTRLSAPGVSVDYIDLEIDSLPTNLQAVIADWEAIAQSAIYL